MVEEAMLHARESEALIPFIVEEKHKVSWIYAMGSPRPTDHAVTSTQLSASFIGQSASAALSAGRLADEVPAAMEAIGCIHLLACLVQ
jgi:hypothetical protein